MENAPFLLILQPADGDADIDGEMLQLAQGSLPEITVL